MGDHDHVVTIEDGVVDGGLGSLVAQRAREAGITTPVQAVGIPRAFLDHATREQLVTELRLRARRHRTRHPRGAGPLHLTPWSIVALVTTGP